MNIKPATAEPNNEFVDELTIIIHDKNEGPYTGRPAAVPRSCIRDTHVHVRYHCLPTADTPILDLARITVCNSAEAAGNVRFSALVGWIAEHLRGVVELD